MTKKHRDAVDRDHMARIAAQGQAALDAYLAEAARVDAEVKQTHAEHMAKVAASVSPVTIPREPSTAFSRWQARKMARHTTSAEHSPHGSSSTRGSSK
jgi:hypothetical protein